MTFRFSVQGSQFNKPLEQTAHPTGFLGLSPSRQGWAAAHRRR